MKKALPSIAGMVCLATIGLWLSGCGNGGNGGAASVNNGGSEAASGLITVSGGTYSAEPMPAPSPDSADKPVVQSVQAPSSLTCGEPSVFQITVAPMLGGLERVKEVEPEIRIHISVVGESGHHWVPFTANDGVFTVNVVVDPATFVDGLVFYVAVSVKDTVSDWWSGTVPVTQAGTGGGSGHDAELVGTWDLQTTFEGHQHTLTMMYLASGDYVGKYDGTVQETGTWETRGDTLTVTTDRVDTHEHVITTVTYEVTDDTLTTITGDGSELSWTRQY